MEEQLTFDRKLINIIMLQINQIMTLHIQGFFLRLVIINHLMTKLRGSYHCYRFVIFDLIARPYPDLLLVIMISL